MNALANAGMTANQRYIELTYIVNEAEEEEEQRNYSVLSKTTDPINIAHHKYACIGN